MLLMISVVVSRVSRVFWILISSWILLYIARKYILCVYRSVQSWLKIKIIQVKLIRVAMPCDLKSCRQYDIRTAWEAEKDIGTFHPGTIYNSLEIVKKLYKFVEFVSNLPWNDFSLNTDLKISWFEKKSIEIFIQIS